MIVEQELGNANGVCLFFEYLNMYSPRSGGDAFVGDGGINGSGGGFDNGFGGDDSDGFDGGSGFDSGFRDGGHGGF